MLSRRSIRIKVMQLLYAKSRDEGLTIKQMFSQFHKEIYNSYELYLYNLLLFTRITQYALHDASKRDSKLLPNEEDKNFTAKLAKNNLIQSLLQNEELEKLYKKSHLSTKIDTDVVRNIYSAFSKTDNYKNYLLEKSNNHKNLLLELYKFCVNNEVFLEKIEDHFTNWEDDRSLIVGSMKKTIKAMPLEEDFYKAYLPNEETVQEFGVEMLKSVYQDDDEYLQIIEPALKNWDAERVAILDMILLKMAICEFTNFPTIPTKVTLNEFVEISKLYSTDKSKDFINGILDRLLKKLQKEGKIKKEGRGLVE